MKRYMMTALAAIALMGTPAVLPATAQATAAEATLADTQQHGAWTALLQAYVRPGEDGVNRFDYGALKANAGDVAALEAYIAGFADLDLAAMSRDEQYVTWVNAYNAVTVQHILGRYPLKSIRSGYIVGPWKRVKTTVAGREISLNDIEHEVLRVDWSEPRTHYAVNCASYGCPNLKPTAWEAATLEQDLADAARAYINHPRGVSIRRDGKLEVSTIYKWFREDFGGTREGVVAHLLDYAEPGLAEQIRANPSIKSYDYDWSLNDVE
ncbi:MAG: DUF547 domain-containing protein [Pseudomonadota bacterium]